MLSCRRRARELRRGSASTGSGSHVRIARSAASSSCAPASLSACARMHGTDGGRCCQHGLSSAQSHWQLALADEAPAQFRACE